MIELHEIVHEYAVELGDDPGLAKDGVEAELQELLARRVAALRDDFRLVRREYPTDIGPVDLLCRDGDGRAVVVEVKRIGEIAGVEQLIRYQERLDLDPSLAPTGRVRGDPHQAAGPGVRAEPWHRLRRDRPRRAARRARRSTCACSERRMRASAHRTSTTVVAIVGDGRRACLAQLGALVNVAVPKPADSVADRAAGSVPERKAGDDPLDRAVAAWAEAVARRTRRTSRTTPTRSNASATRGCGVTTSRDRSASSRWPSQATLARWRVGSIELPDYYVVLDAEAMVPTRRHWYLGVLHRPHPPGSSRSPNAHERLGPPRLDRRAVVAGPRPVARRDRRRRA